MKSKIKRKNKSWLIIIGSLLSLIGISLIFYDFYSNRKIKKDEENAIQEYYKEEIKTKSLDDEIIQINEEVNVSKINYIAILKIPKINLERGLVDQNSYLNNVNYNVEILDNSDMPNVKNGNVILAAHSGNSRISYFKNLDKLDIADEISIDYQNKIYTYKVTDKYLIEKTGTAEIIKNKNKNTLTLITCKHNTNNQIVIIAELK